MYRIPNEEIYTIGAAADPRPKQQVFLPEPFQWSFFPAFLFCHLDPPSRQLGSPDFWITFTVFFFFFYRLDRWGRNNRPFFDDHKMKREHLAERNIIRLAFIGILRRNFKLIVATIFSDYRTGRTSIILSLLISLKMLARCCLRITSHGGTGLNIKCLEISVALFCLILQST